MRLSTKEVQRYLENLNEDGLRFLLLHLILYPEERKFTEKQIEEFNRMYKGE